MVDIWDLPTNPHSPPAEQPPSLRVCYPQGLGPSSGGEDSFPLLKNHPSSAPQDQVSIPSSSQELLQMDRRIGRKHFILGRVPEGSDQTSSLPDLDVSFEVVFPEYRLHPS